MRRAGSGTGGRQGELERLVERLERCVVGRMAGKKVEGWKVEGGRWKVEK